jgi:hypothetical protein
MEQIPERFAIRMFWKGRRGFGLFMSVNHTDERDGNNKPILIFSRVAHHDYFYNITVTNDNSVWETRTGVKQGGTVRAQFDWKYNYESLVNDRENLIYPIIKLTPVATVPILQSRNFIPIVERAPINHIEPAPVPLHIPAPVIPIPQEPIRMPHNKYPIQDIPQHAIRCLLQGAVILGEICPISNNDIDIENGAVTTCFHIFDKTYIQIWLTMPNSRDKCPVCNAACNMYTLNVV